MTDTPAARRLPVWRQIRNQLRDAIVAGQYGPGDRLPTEQALAQSFGVNRHTVRRAVGSLAEAGLLRVEQGRGMFVQEHVLDYPIGTRTRFTETVARQNRSRGRRILSVATCRAEPLVAEALGLLVGRPVIELRALQEVDDRPISLSTDWFSQARFPDIDRHAADTLSVTESLRRSGVTDYFRQRTRVTTRMPRRDEAEALRQPTSRPVLVTENLDADEAGQPVAFGITVWAGDRIQLVFGQGR